MQRLLVDGSPCLAQISHVFELGSPPRVKFLCSSGLGMDLSLMISRLHILSRLVLHLLVQLPPLLLQLLLRRAAVPRDGSDVSVEGVNILLELIGHSQDGPHLVSPHQLLQQRRVLVHAVELGLREAIAVPIVEVRVRQLRVHQEERVGAVEPQSVDEVGQRVLDGNDVDLVHVLRRPRDGRALLPWVFRSRVVPDERLDHRVHVLVQLEHAQVVLEVDVRRLGGGGVGGFGGGDKGVRKGLLHMLEPWTQRALSEVQLVVPIPRET
mmetsp:Transcript_50900/g.159040  ORF Transcript_50900/g.159040 Transcript_50900/m.159040 type:complete len:267 (-) Transcript_50900:441-1241(-)